MACCRSRSVPVDDSGCAGFGRARIPARSSSTGEVDNFVENPAATCRKASVGAAQIGLLNF